MCFGLYSDVGCAVLDLLVLEVVCGCDGVCDLRDCLRALCVAVPCLGIEFGFGVDSGVLCLCGYMSGVACAFGFRIFGVGI